MDRQASQHQGPGRAVQDGGHGCRIHHFDHRGQVTTFAAARNTLGPRNISVGKPRLDWSALIGREKDLIKAIPANLARSMAHRKVEVIRGRAVFVGPNAVRIGHPAHLEAKHIVIATGSKPRPLPIPGAEHMITSDQMLSERSLPASVIFVGGGVISLKFVHVYARASADVIILEALPQLLPAIDAYDVARLQAESERMGIRVKTGVSVERIEP